MAVLNAPALRPAHVWMSRLRPLLLLAGALAVAYTSRTVPLWPALLVLAVGEFIECWAAANLRKTTLVGAEKAARGEAPPPPGVTETGPYAWSRNPMYIGRFVVALGVCLLSDYRWVLVGPLAIVFALYAHARVEREEVRLQQILGEPYAQYLQRVPRWLPRRLASARQTFTWSWSSLLSNHQYHAVIAIAMAIVLVILRRHLF